MDSYAAFPLQRQRAARRSACWWRWTASRSPTPTLAEALLKIVAGRIVAEIERSRADEALRAAALAVSSARGASVFDELVRYLATILHVEMAFIARHEPGRRAGAAHAGDVVRRRMLQDIRYPLAGTPCETVLGQQFRAYPSRLRELFPDDATPRRRAESYAGLPADRPTARRWAWCRSPRASR